MPGARREIGLVERRVLMCLYQGLLKLGHVREFLSTGKKELYVAVFFYARAIAREFSCSD